MEQKMLKFVTGNKNKFREVQEILSPIKVEQIKLHLTEIQDLDPLKIMDHKLREAFKQVKGEFIIEDDSLYLECLDDKLPGPFIKWFNDSIGNRGLLKMIRAMRKSKVRELVVLAYVKNRKNIKIFTATVKGRVVSPKGRSDFNFDPIFLANGSKKTFAQMTLKEKSSVSARGKAVGKLKSYLLKQA